MTEAVTINDQELAILCDIVSSVRFGFTFTSFPHTGSAADHTQKAPAPFGRVHRGQSGSIADASDVFSSLVTRILIRCSAGGAMLRLKEHDRCNQTNR
jgi:hypothetical protein